MITTPKALGEVLAQKGYEFVKPRRMMEGLKTILGVGILLAEGDEHRVSGEQVEQASRKGANIDIRLRCRERI
jgi:hypothetical protein